MSRFERGAIISPIQFNNPGSARFRLDDQLVPVLPGSVLYWDRLVAPIAMRGLAPRYEREIEALCALGVAETFVLHEEQNLSGDNLRHLSKKVSSKMMAYRSDQDQSWSYTLPMGAGDPINEPLLEGPSPQRTATILNVEIRRGLPVPTREVPYEDILNFREQRRDELAELNSAVDQIAATYALEPNESVALGKAVSEVERCLDRVERICDERWTRTFSRAFASSFAFEGLAAGVTGGAISAGVATLFGTARTLLTEQHMPDELKAFAVAIEAERL